MPGKAPVIDVQRLIIEKCFAAGGDRLSGKLQVAFETVASEVQVSVNTVSRTWRWFCTTMVEDPFQTDGDFNSKLIARDLELIETLKTVKGSISLGELYSAIEDFGDVGGQIYLSSISRAIKNKLLSRQRCSQKRITHVTLEHFISIYVVYAVIYQLSVFN